jgi:hypothetical protein
MTGWALCLEALVYRYSAVDQAYLFSEFASLNVTISLCGQFDPFTCWEIHHCPLLHQSAVTWIEVLAAAIGDQLVDPVLWELDDQLAPHLHRKNFPLHIQDAIGTEHSASTDFSVAGKGCDNWRKTRGDLVRGRFLGFLLH